MRGFPGCKGSIDGMHWVWKNCPAGWAGQFQGKEKRATIVLEAVASQSTRIWHAFFGSPGSLNDINVLNQSPIFDRFLSGWFSINASFIFKKLTMIQTGTDELMTYKVNNNEYTRGYYLADGIYPQWPVLIKTINNPGDAASSHYATMQEAARKDIERTFGGLQGKWHILAIPCRLWALHDIRRIMYACIVLHNMVVEDREVVDPKVEDFATRTEIIPNRRDPGVRLSPSDRVGNYIDLRDAEIHRRLMNDLKIHNWVARGTQGARGEQVAQ